MQDYSRRLVKDLECKGILRTTVETVNLQIHAEESDPLAAECIRTMPTVTFPATMLLKREEIETRTKAGQSVIAAVYHGGAARNRAFVEAPFDLMYGFRGQEQTVDLMSPYEMLVRQRSRNQIMSPEFITPHCPQWIGYCYLRLTIYRYWVPCDTNGVGVDVQGRTRQCGTEQKFQRRHNPRKKIAEC